MNPARIQFDLRMFDDLPVLVWMVEPNGTPAWFNKAMLAFAGYENPVTLAQDWFGGVHAEDQASYLATIRQALEGHEAFAIEYRRRNDMGEYRRLTEHGTPLRDDAGAFCGFVGIMTDVTDTDLAGGRCAAPVELLSQVTHDMVWDWELRTNEVAYNAAFIETLGAAPPEYHAAHAWWRTRAHPDDVEPIVRMYDEAMKTGGTRLSYEYRIRDRNDAYITLDSRASLTRDVAGRIIRLLVVSRDISKRRRAEEAQDRLIRILEATTDYVGMATADGHSFYINAAGRKMVGLDANESLGFHISENHPDWANEIILQEAIPTATREGYWRGENALRHRSGHEIPVSQVLLSHRGTDGEVEFLSTIIRDLSERKREEIERIEWANRYDAAIRASGQVLFDWNSSTNEIAYAGDMERLLGYTIAEMAGGLDRFRQLIHRADLPLFDQQIQQIISTRDPFHLEFRVRHKAAGCIYLEAKGYFFLDRRGQIGRMVGFFGDVTEQRKAQEALAQAHESLEQRVAERTTELARVSAVIEDRAHQQEVVVQLGQRALSGAPLGGLLDDAMKIIQMVLHADCCSLFALTWDGKELVARGANRLARRGFRRPRARGPHGSQSGYTRLLDRRAGDRRRLLHGNPLLRFGQREVAAGIKSGLSVLIKGDEGPLGVLAAFTFATAHLRPGRRPFSAIGRQRAHCRHSARKSRGKHPAGPRTSGVGEPGQDGIPLAHEPRVAHPTQCHSRFHATDGSRKTRAQSGRERGPHLASRETPPRAHQ